jgi:hypothetical protein
MLYQAIHVPAGHAPLPRSVLSDPPIHHYLAEFGSRPGDDAVVSCELQGPSPKCVAEWTTWIFYAWC